MPKIKSIFNFPSAWRTGETDTNYQCFHCGQRYSRGTAGYTIVNGHRYALGGGCGCGEIPALVIRDEEMQSFKKDYEVKPKRKISKWVDERNKMPMRIVLNQETNGIDAWYYARCTKPSKEVVVEWSDAVKIVKILAKCKPVKGAK